jgi:hypothetical protein
MTLRRALILPALLIGFAWVGLKMAETMLAQGARLAAEGVLVTGEVLARHETVSGSGNDRRTTRALEVRYPTEAGPVERRFTLPQRSDWRGFEVGAPIFVRHIPGETLARLPAFEPQPGDGSLDPRLLALAPLVLGLVVLVANLRALRRSAAGARAPTG